MKGVFLDCDSLDHGDLDFTALRAALPCWQLHGSTRPVDTATRISGAEVVVSNKVLLDESALATAPHLRLIAIAATGTNNVDLCAAAQRGIAVCNIRRYATPSVVQHVFALLLALSRRLNDYQRAVQQGDWQRSDKFCLLDYPIRELGELTLGIVGFGELGRAVAETAEHAFGMRVMIAQRPGGVVRPGRVALHELLSQVDVLSLHCPLTAETRGLIGKTELARMKPDALLINTARGGLVDEAALVAALQSGRIGGAGIDVLATEPPGNDSPLLQQPLPNLIVTPHIAWASRESRQRLLDQLAANITAFVSGSPQHLVTK
jgi:glycerate dehydrogenase